MFVVSLVADGDLKKNAVIRTNANDAVKLAKRWHEEHSPHSQEDDYIAIDQEIRGEEETKRFAIISFNSESDSNEVKLYLGTGELPPFQSRYHDIAKEFLVAAIGYALTRITDHLRTTHI